MSENETGIVRAEPMQVTTAYVPTTLNVDEVLAQLEVASVAQRRAIRIAVSMTRPNDWVEMRTPDGKKTSYLQSTGAERVLAALGLHARTLEGPVEESFRDDAGEYYVVRYRVGLFNNSGQQVAEHDGECSSRDKFFGTIKGELKPLEAVDRVNIRKKAYTNAFNQAVCRRIGLRGLTSQDLTELGMQAANSVTYNAPSKTGPSEEQKKAASQAQKIDPTTIDKNLPIHAREIGTVDGPALLTLWKNEAERVGTEYGLDAYEHYLKFQDGRCYSIDNPDRQGQKLSQKMRSWLEGTFRKMVVEFPEKGIEPAQIADGDIPTSAPSNEPTADDLFGGARGGNPDAR